MLYLKCYVFVDGLMENKTALHILVHNYGLFDAFTGEKRMWLVQKWMHILYEMFFLLCYNEQIHWNCTLELEEKDVVPVKDVYLFSESSQNVILSGVFKLLAEDCRYSTVKCPRWFTFLWDKVNAVKIS